MPSSFASALDQEILDLEAELRADPRQAKLAELKRVRDLFYSEPNDQSVNFTKNVSRAASIIREISALGRKPSPTRERILTEAASLVEAGNGEPVPTASIHERLASLGLEVGGDRPINNLSAIISNSRRFQAHGRRGWTMLKPGEEVDAMDDALADEAPAPEDADPNE